METARFEDLKLIQPILRAVEEEGYEFPTEIQQVGIPEVLAGRDLLATAQTGTGKTAAFVLPMLQLFHENKPVRGKGVRGLILTPTRELALQIDESIQVYGRHLDQRTAVVLGGVPSRPQIQALRRDPEFLIATPGRLLDLHGQGHVDLKTVEVLVLDEADRMLDMGFIRDVRKIVALTPEGRQTLFFSATLVPAIARFASNIVHDPAKVQVTPPASVPDTVEQQVLFVARQNKRALLVELLKGDEIERALVFTRTKIGADRVVSELKRHKVSADVIHSNKNQQQRQRALARFDQGKTRVLVATDIVARGIDVESISHVVNFDLPEDPESYVHRIGRTARAGAAGTAISLCDAAEVTLLRRIEALAKVSPERVEDHPYHEEMVAGMHRPRKPTPSWLVQPKVGVRTFGGRRTRRRL